MHMLKQFRFRTIVAYLHVLFFLEMNSMIYEFVVYLLLEKEINNYRV